ncbi:uncharacterized protein LOC135349723 isoform X2 [Halichondria panicea]|uniref:uncharacterized protein LOC135349723 isoform X2 n=1 Tax=Halichondria panicea TaxID=6063 RepID=UPI00312B9867
MGNCIDSSTIDGSSSNRSSRADQPLKQSYGTETQRTPPPTQSPRLQLPAVSLSKSTAKPIGQFRFLDRKYSVTTPECGVTDIDEVFKSVCERYDIAVINREKIDEALTLFKTILDMELDTSLEECFTAWKEFLVNPQFIVNCIEATGDVKDIRVRADDIPKVRRKAQKHIRDLLDACHLFLQQREFLQRNIMDDLSKLEDLARDLHNIANHAKLSSSQKKHLEKNFSGGQAMVATFPETIELFWRQTYSLVHDINTSVHVLDGVPGPESADLR